MERHPGRSSPIVETRLRPAEVETKTLRESERNLSAGVKTILLWAFSPRKSSNKTAVASEDFAVESIFRNWITYIWNVIRNISKIIMVKIEFSSCRMNGVGFLVEH